MSLDIPLTSRLESIAIGNVGHLLKIEDEEFQMNMIKQIMEIKRRI